MYLVRADGNAQIGAGHLMRCLTIIGELVRITGSGEEVLFVCADEASADLARDRGFRALSLETDYRDMESELPRWKEILEEVNGIPAPRGAVAGKHAILVDSYYVTEAYLQGLQAYGRVILLDDMQQKPFPADVIVNYNVFAKEEKYQELYGGDFREKVTLCIGGAYVPLRPQFFNVEYPVADAVTDILITTGGGDVDNIAGAILKKIHNEKLNYHLITGRFNPHLQELEELAKRCGNVHIYHDVQDMAGLMRKCDIAITAGGTTIYELSAIGVPFVCFSYAENQEALTAYIGEQKVACFAGAYHKEPWEVLERIALMVTDLCTYKEKRNMCYLKEKKLIDGKGAERLARMMLG